MIKLTVVRTDSVATKIRAEVIMSGRQQTTQAFLSHHQSLQYKLLETLKIWRKTIYVLASDKTAAPMKQK